MIKCAVKIVSSPYHLSLSYKGINVVVLCHNIFPKVDTFVNVDVEVFFRRVPLYATSKRRRAVEVSDRFIESKEMCMCNKHFRVFEAENAKRIERFKLYFGSMEAIATRNHIFENCVCGPMGSLKPEAWSAFREFLGGEERLL